MEGEVIERRLPRMSKTTCMSLQQLETGRLVKKEEGASIKSYHWCEKTLSKCTRNISN